jgi:hypothetical protein
MYKNHHRHCYEKRLHAFLSSHFQLTIIVKHGIKPPIGTINTESNPQVATPMSVITFWKICAGMRATTFFAAGRCF